MRAQVITRCRGPAGRRDRRHRRGQTPQAQADATYGKLMGIVAAGQSSKGTGRRTVLTESEMNAYLHTARRRGCPSG